MNRIKSSTFCRALIIGSMITAIGLVNVGEQGKTGADNIAVQYIDIKPSIAETSEIPFLNTKLFYIPEIPLNRELQEYTYDLCLEKNIDYELALAVMWRESRFDVNATGHNTNGTKDSGIMQINDINKGWIENELGITDLHNPKQNIFVGLTMLSGFIDKYGEHDGLIAYGAGEVGMKRLKSKGITTNKSVQLAFDKRDEIELMEKV